MNNLNAALVAALNEAAATGDKWTAGEAAFVQARNNGADIDAALVAALDMAADDQAHWTAGYETFWASYPRNPVHWWRRPIQFGKSAASHIRDRHTQPPARDNRGHGLI